MMSICADVCIPGLRGFAEVWNETVQELRYRWDQAIPINRWVGGRGTTSSLQWYYMTDRHFNFSFVLVAVSDTFI